ncbi:hypothetical protein [Nocardia cyriacigeorgica]|uniref:hypothetical protein n=1 Tax=Nocardia cyriacigeorgica TaxID=135487 RepID=UPI0024554331|nr:hypothetical protein [Nocardia cyriacigeorgica]
MNDRSNALGLVRREGLDCSDRVRAVLSDLAERHGYRLVFTVELSTVSDLVSNLVIAQHITEHDAVAVIVPSFGHTDGLRELIIENAALVTPIRVYPRGHRWHGLEVGAQS